MTTALLTLGRLPKALDIARALHGAGVRVIVAEPFRRHLSGVSNAVDRNFVVTAPAVDGPRYLDESANLGQVPRTVRRYGRVLGHEDKRSIREFVGDRHAAPDGCGLQVLRCE